MANYEGILKLATAASARKVFEAKCDAMANTFKLIYQAATIFKDKDMAESYYGVAATIWDELEDEVFEMFPDGEDDGENDNGEDTVDKDETGEQNGA